MSTNKPALRNIVSCYQNRNKSQCENNLITKILGNILRLSHILSKTRAYGIQRRTLLNFVTDAFVSVFWNSFSENFGKYTEKCMQWSSLYGFSPQPPTRPKCHYSYFPRTVQRRECSIILETSKKNFTKIFSNVIGHFQGQKIFYRFFIWYHQKIVK